MRIALTMERILKRRRIRKNPDGSPNEEDIKHNEECYRRYKYIDNPWMFQEPFDQTQIGMVKKYSIE